MLVQARRGLPPDVSLEKMTDFYFSLCSIQARGLHAGTEHRLLCTEHLLLLFLSISMALLLTHGTDVMQATCRIMSVVAATLANGGVCPLTNEEVFTSDTVKRVSCHIYADRGPGGSHLLQLQSCRCPS